MNEQESARLIGGLEFLAGAGLIGLTTFSPEVKDAAIFGYVFGGFAVADGGADLISGRIGYLIGKIDDSIIKVYEKRKYLKEDNGSEDEE